MCVCVCLQSECRLRLSAFSTHVEQRVKSCNSFNDGLSECVRDCVSVYCALDSFVLIFPELWFSVA